MLLATKYLLELYKNDRNHERKAELKKVYAQAIAQYGSYEDVEVLLPAFLEAAEQRDELIEPLMVLGNVSTAKNLFKACFKKEQLRSGIPEDILHCLGYLGYLPAQSLLFEYAKSEDYYLSKAACMGLLNLPCDGLERKIEKEIKKCYGKHLFPEFIPALAIKTKNDSILHELFQLGQTTTSTDCNSGIILGIALYGEKGFDWFKKIIWNPDWDAVNSSTGSRLSLYIGTQYLGIRLVELYLELKQRHASNPISELQYKHDFNVIKSLLDLQIVRPRIGLRFVSELNESYTQLYTHLFTWSDPNHDDSIIGLASQTFGYGNDIVSRLYEIEKRLLLCMEQEITIQQIQTS